MANGVHVVLKLALSLDGRIASRTGVSRWITGPVARARVHALRAQHTAVGVGIGTALADDPELTVRDAQGKDPIRVVFDSQLRLPTGSKLALTARTTRVIVLCAERASQEGAAALEACGVEVLRVASSASDGHLDMGSALGALAQAAIDSILVEGGAAIAGALLSGQHVDELHAFIAPLLLGPSGRACAVVWSGPASPDEAPHISDPVIEPCGPDVYVHGRMVYPPAASP
jgi:diaminohydroxyphosphoribosylaminopyrimidine deaminase / 5-amino-6-(5-phosphoribosylamino)uracil reductase